MRKFLSFFRKKKVIAPPKLFRRCNELPIHNFNELINNQDFNYLKKNIDEMVSYPDLESAWLDIMDEYFTLTKNPTALNQLKKKMQILILEKKINVLELLKYCIDIKINVDPELKIYGLNKENLHQHLGLMKNDLLKRIGALPEEIESSNNEFDRSIAVLLSRGFSVNRFKTVVSEWVAMLEIVEQQNKVKE